MVCSLREVGDFGGAWLLHKVILFPALNLFLRYYIAFLLAITLQCANPKILLETKNVGYYVQKSLRSSFISIKIDYMAIKLFN